jgi:dephospho-CoA kinase
MQLTQELPAWRIGLTGGIGSGKSTVACMLADAGATVIDADAISRQVTAPGGAAIAPIADRFGASAITADGAMDRDVMRRLVFGDSAARLQLEAIIHPLVSQASARQAQLAESAGSTCLVFDIPLLVESGRWRQQLDQVLVVDCEETTQISRVMAREAARPGAANGWTPETVRKVIDGQASRAQRRAAADLCIYNEGLSLAALGLTVKQILQRFKL